MNKTSGGRLLLFSGLHVASLALVIFSSVSEFYFFSGYIAIALMIVSGVWLARAEQALFWTALYFVFALSSTVLISIFVEHGIYLWEIRRWSDASGLTAIAWYQVLLVMTGVIFSYRAIDAVKLRFFSFPSVMRMGLEQLIRVVALLMIAVLVSIAMLYGTPSEHGVHRMDYWAYYAPAWGGAVAYWIIQLSFPLGYIYAHRKCKIDIAIFFLILLVSVYMGERYTGLVLACFFFFLPIALLEAKKPLSVFFSWRGAMVLVLLLLLLVTAVLASYGTSLSRAVEMVLARAGVQAQMWWALNEAVGASLMPIGDILGHYFGFGTENQDSGVYYLMKQVAPMDVVNYRIETGSAFTMSGVFNNVYFFGYALGGLVNVLYGAVFGVSCGLLKKALESRNLIVSLFAFKLMYKLMVVLLSGKTDMLFTWGNLAFFLIVIAFLRLSVSRYEYQCR